MKAKVFCLLLLSIGVLCSCTKGNDYIEPQDPPIEQPEKPIIPDVPKESDIDTENIINIKIEDKIMAIVGNTNWKGITYGNGKYVAVGRNKIISSTDGINWETIKEYEDKAFTDVAYGDGKFVAIENFASALYSTNGIDWEQVNIPYQTYLTKIRFLNNEFVIVGDGGGSSVSTIMRSADGISWNHKNYSSKYLSDIAFGEGIYLVSGHNAAYELSDEGGLTERPNASCISKAIAYGNGKFVMVGKLGKISSKYVNTHGWFATKLGDISWNNVTYDNE